WFKPGDLLRIQKVPDCMAILHISMLGTTDEPMVNLTVAPIAYSEYKIGDSRVVSITPPANINLLGRFPMFVPMASKPAP
ncbi:MAG: hypothetical protein RI957_2080, partial [Verrucomicrobiota bacterium]